MRDVNGSSFLLMSSPSDWTLSNGMAWDGTAQTLAQKQAWRLPSIARDAARAALAATQPVVVDSYGTVARIRTDGSTIESQQDATTWIPLADIDGKTLAPKIGRFVDMSLGGARLALIASDGTNAFLQLFDLRGRWALDSPENSSLPVQLDTTAVQLGPGGRIVTVAPDGPIYVVVQGGLAIYEGGPIEQFVERRTTRFEPLAPNPMPLRRTALLSQRPGGAVVAMTVDARHVALLCDQGNEPQTIAVLDRGSGLWTTAPVTATDGTQLPYATDIGLLDNGSIALMAPIPQGPNETQRDCAVVVLAPPTGVTLVGRRYPLLSQSAPRFTAIPGPDVRYLDATGPRSLLPLPHPGFATQGAIARMGLTGDDPDLVWHRLYVEAYIPPGTSITIWARAAEESISDPAAQAKAINLILAASPQTARIGPAPTGVSSADPLAPALAVGPFHRQPRLVAAALASELPFHPGLGPGDGAPFPLYELLLQRSVGANRRLSGAVLDLVVVMTGEGRHSPCLRAVRIYTPRFCYQDQYLPPLFHQTRIADESDLDAAVSAPDFRERLLASFEGMLTPIENRAAAAQYLLDPYAAPVDALPWLGTYLGLNIEPSWPETRRRRALAEAGRQMRMRGTYRGVCLALDIATDGAVARGEVVLLETHRLRRTDATVLGISMSGRNVLTQHGVASGNSIVGDTLVLSAERALEVLALLAPSVAQGAEASQVARFLDEYADRVQVAALVHSADPTLVPVVTAVLKAELPAQLNFEVVVSDRTFILGLAPLLGIDTFLEPPGAAAPLRLNGSALGLDAVIRDPAALRQ